MAENMAVGRNISKRGQSSPTRSFTSLARLALTYCCAINHVTTRFKVVSIIFMPQSAECTCVTPSYYTTTTDRFDICETCVQCDTFSVTLVTGYLH